MITDLKSALAAAGMVAIPGLTPKHKIRDPDFCRLLGIEDEQSEIVQEIFYSRIHPDDRNQVQASFEAGVRSGMVFLNEFRICLAGGGIRWILAKGMRLTEQGNARDYFILQDVTERKRIEEELLQKTQELTLANQKLERFSAIIAHDLKNPLTSIVMLANLLGSTPSLEDVSKYSQTIKSVGLRMSDLIDDVLEFAKASSLTELAKEAVALGPLLESVQSNLAAAINETQAKLEIETTLPEVYGNASQLFQLFQNLISNALKYRGARRPELRIGCREENRLWVVWVKDNGLGLDPMKSKNLFEPFQRFHTAIEGTGLGLAICKKIVERHGGRIWVESKVGSGSRFYFTLAKGDPSLKAR